MDCTYLEAPLFSSTLSGVKMSYLKPSLWRHHMDRRRIGGIVAAPAALLALGLVGCNSGTDTNSPPPPTTTVVTTPAPGTPTAAPNANAPGTNNVNAGPGGATGANAQVADAVDQAIHENVQMTGSRVTAVVDANGVATLTGTAQNAQQKALAAQAATNTSGVTAVKNKIEIAPTGGATSASKPATTKIIVIHENSGGSGSGNSSGSSGQSSAPASPDASSTTTGQTGSSTDNSGNSTAPPSTTQ
jgi:hypothetical protein